MAKGFSNWLSPAFGGDLELRPDLDQVEALAPEREALWTRLEAASFLTDDEKRAAAGYGPPLPALGDSRSPAKGLPSGRSRRPPSAVKFNPYHDDAGRFTTAEGGLTGPGHGLGGEGKPAASNNDDRERVAQQAAPRTRSGPLAQYPEATPAQIVRFGIASRNADNLIRQVRELEPYWKPTPSFHESMEGAIAAAEGEAAQATARLGEIARQGIGGNYPPAETAPLGSAASSLQRPGYETTYQLGLRPPELPDFLVHKQGRGKLSGSDEALRKLNNNKEERNFVNEQIALGNNVDVVDTGEDRTPDFAINGIRHEYKHLSKVRNQDSNGLSKAISDRAMTARGQAPHIILDARDQVGMTLEIARRGIGRTYGADNNEGSKIQSITVMTKVGPAYAPRRK
jgi:Contact-dependent growth inhibition CdiA C-terminal domain